MLDVAFADGSVVLATEEHPFLLANGRWWAAGVLEPGEVVVQRAEGGGPGAARAIDSVSETGQRTRVFNLEVEGLHTYLVGDSAWVVHNAGCPPKRRPTTRFLADDRGAIDDLQPTLDRISTGGRHPHRNDGSIFRNFEGRLPVKPGGHYREYVHPTPGQTGVGAKRIVVGADGELYFTPDHYESFLPLN